MTLCAFVCLCSFVIAFVLGSERLRSAAEKTARYEARIITLREAGNSKGDLTAERDQLADLLTRSRVRYYSSGEISLFGFGTMVKKKLSSRGITVVRYQVVEQKDTSSLEFTVHAPVVSLVSFLKDVSENDRYWTVSFFKLTMRESSDTADAVFRIGYAVLDF